MTQPQRAQLFAIPLPAPMDSTPLQEPTLKPLSSSSSSSSASKLPIKRKAPHRYSPFLLSPRLVPSSPATAAAIPITTINFDSKPSPFKFHRIWSEPDEILFLQGLVDSSSNGLSFPRDMGIFYHNFSNTTSQPYTKSQFSEKFRRLRKKFRVTSSRLSRGRDPSLLSPHDRVIFNLSKKLWGEELESSSRLGTYNKIDSVNSSSISRDYAERIKVVGVKVTFSPVLPANLSSHKHDVKRFDFGALGMDKLSNVKVGEASCEVKKNVVAESVMNVFDESLKEVQRVREREKLRASTDSNFEKKWRAQRVAEVDVLAQRLRLVLENSVNRLSVS